MLYTITAVIPNFWDQHLSTWPISKTQWVLSQGELKSSFCVSWNASFLWAPQNFSWSHKPFMWWKKKIFLGMIYYRDTIPGEMWKRVRNPSDGRKNGNSPAKKELNWEKVEYWKFWSNVTGAKNTEQDQVMRTQCWGEKAPWSLLWFGSSLHCDGHGGRRHGHVCVCNHEAWVKRARMGQTSWRILQFEATKGLVSYQHQL